MTAAKAMAGSARKMLAGAGVVLLILALALCLIALLFSGNPLYFVFGVIVVSLLGIVVAVLRNNDPG